LYCLALLSVTVVVAATCIMKTVINNSPLIYTVFADEEAGFRDIVL